MNNLKKIFSVALAAFSLSASAVTHHRPPEERTRPEKPVPSALDSIVPVDARRAGAHPKKAAGEAGLKELHGIVTRVSDGDTIWVRELPSRNPTGTRKYKIRLDRIDAPESGQAFGERSKEFLKSLISAKKVVVRYETEDQYGRILGVVYLDGEDINLRMVAEGYAWHYSHFDKTPAYVEAEMKARSARRGLWSQPFPERPYEFRHRERHGGP